MESKRRLDGLEILVVDDELDIRRSIFELLPMCHVTEASNFKEGKELLESRHFDIAILDIMGVDGYGLLETAKEKGTIAVMLTAHALSPRDIAKSFTGGAASYISKEKMEGIEVFLNDILDAQEKGEHFWSRWLKTWDRYYANKFGPNWHENEKEFWRKINTI